MRLLRSPVLHIAAVVSLTLALAFAAAVGLTLAKFERALTDAIDARYRIHADDIRAGIETGIDLGLGLDEIRGNVEGLVTDRLAVDAGIRAIRVTDASGTDVLSVEGEGRAGVLDRRQTVSIANDFGRKIGDVTVTHVAGSDGALLAETARTLAANAAILAAIAAAVSSLACLIAMAPVPRTLRRVLSALEAPAAQADTAPDGGIAAEAVLAAEKLQQVTDEIAAVAASLPAARNSEAA